MSIARRSNFLVSNYTDTVTTPTVLKDHQTRQHEPRPNFLQSGNAAILARSPTCTAGMALKIHDVERALPVQHLVRTYLRRQASIFPSRLRFIEGSLARQNSNGVSTAGTRARSNSDGRWFKLGICWATSTAVTSESPLNNVMYVKPYALKASESWVNCCILSPFMSNYFLIQIWSASQLQEAFPLATSLSSGSKRNTLKNKGNYSVESHCEEPLQRFRR